VLAIDDDPMALELTAAVLAPDGFEVLRAGSGAEGIELARLEKPSLIILDLLMPGMDGFAVAAALRDDPATEQIPIVVLTSQSLSSEDRERLNSRVRYLAEKTGFDRARFVQLVRHLCATEGSHGR
jgi:CheY-like chemotaxis protein